VPSTVIAVATCPRVGASYVEATIAGLDAAGAVDCDRRLLLIDGGELVPAAQGWDQRCFYPQRGPRAMLWAAFESALAVGADRLIFCQDDITPCRNAVRRMMSVELPAGFAFMDFHDQLHVPAGALAGLYSIELAHGFTGTLALVLPRQVLEWLVQQDPMSMRRDQERGGVLMGDDVVLGVLLARSPWPRYAAHLPRLVRHDGVVSAAHPDKKLEGTRATRDFPGEDFDALSL
jgi:hypothetical protein